MRNFFRQFKCSLVLLLACCHPATAQDIQTRVEAIRLMDRANAVSHSSHKPPIHKESVSFRAYRLDGMIVDGKVEKIFAGNIERYEITFGDYHAISIHYPDKIVQNEYEPLPQKLWRKKCLRQSYSAVLTIPTRSIPSRRQPCLAGLPIVSNSRR